MASCTLDGVTDLKGSLVDSIFNSVLSLTDHDSAKAPPISKFDIADPPIKATIAHPLTLSKLDIHFGFEILDNHDLFLPDF